MMPIATSLIAGRERLLDGIFGIRPNQVLNPPLSGEVPRPSNALAVELKRAINALKAEAYAEETGRMDYRRLSGSPAYLHYRTHCSPQLRAFDLASLTTREERLAFWINLYNALVIDAVIGIGLQTAEQMRAWSMLPFLRRAAYTIGGYRFSCEDIEHGILRANRGNPFLPGPHFTVADPRRQFVLEAVDPRIHFALNCGRRSCPPIAIYATPLIDEQLDWAAQSFVTTTVQLDRQRRTLSLSRIFQWYRGDFGGRAGIIAFVLQHLSDEDCRRWLREHQQTVRLVHQPYDWALNAR